MAGLVEKFKEMWSPAEEYEDDYEEESGFRSRKDSSNRVVSINATAKLKVVLVKPEKFGEEVKNIADNLVTEGNWLYEKRSPCLCGVVTLEKMPYAYHVRLLNRVW